MTNIASIVAGTKFPAPIGLSDDQVAKGVPLADGNLLQGHPKFLRTLAELIAYPKERLMPRNEGTVYADPVRANNGLYILSEDMTTWSKASSLAAAAHTNKVQGGTHLYNTIAERNAIPLDLRHLGMNVKVWEGGRVAGNGINPTQVAYILLGNKTPFVPAGYTYGGVTKIASIIYEIVEYTGLYSNHPDYDATNPGAAQTNTRIGFATDIDPLFADSRPDALYQMNFVELLHDDGVFSVKFDEPHWYYDKYYYQVEIDSDGDGVVDSYRGYTLLDYPPYEMAVRILDVTPGTPDVPAGRDLMGIAEDQSDVWALIPIQAAVTYTTFEELKQFRNKSQLEKYTYYAYEYYACYMQNGTRAFTEANAENQKELMICFATDSNKISNLVQSAKHPGDVISMLFDAGVGGMAYNLGIVDYRFDPHTDISAHFDWRNYKVARYRVAGFKHNLVTKVSASEFSVTPLAYWQTNYDTIPQEFFIDFGTAPLTNAAGPKLTVKATNATVTLSLPLVDLNGNAIAADQVRTIVGATGKAHVYKSQPLNAWVLASSADEEAIIKDLPLLTPDPATKGATVVPMLYRNVELLPTGGVELFDIISGVSSGTRGIHIGTGVSMGNNPNLLLFSKRGGAAALDVNIGSSCDNVTVVRVDGENVYNIRIGRLSKDIVTIGSTAKVELPAFSEKVLLAGNSHRTLSFVEEPGASPLLNVVLFAPKQDSTSRRLDLSFKLLSDFTMIVRGVGFVQAQLGEAEQSSIYVHTLFNRVRIGRFANKVFERGSSWDGVEYLGGSHLPVTLIQPQWFRGTVQSRLIVDTASTIFNIQPANGQNTDKLLSIDPLTGEVRTLAYPAQQQELKGVVDATPDSIAQRDNLGGLFATEFTLVSDARLKTGLEKISPEQALSMVRMLSGYYYRRNDIADAPLEIGYLAQEVQAIVPELTKHIHHELYEDALGVNYARAVTLLAPALQALYERIVSLEKQLK